MFITLIKKIGKLLVSYWNIWGAVILSSFIAWIHDFSRGAMDTTTSYLVLTLTCIGFFTFFKSFVFSKKGGKATPIEKAVSNQKSVKAVRTALDPLKQGQELGESIVDTVIITKRIGGKLMKKFKDFFKSLWGNKFTIMNTVIVLFSATMTQVMTYTKQLYKINWFSQHEMFVKIGSPILAGIIVFVDLLTTYTKYGFESLKELEDRKLSKLSRQEKRALKERLRVLKQELNKLVQKKKECINSIKQFETLTSLGLQLSDSDNRAFENARQVLRGLDNAILELETKLNELNQKL